MVVLSGCGSDEDGGDRESEGDYGGTPSHLVPEDEKLLIAFARDLPEYYKAIGATMPPNTLESFKTATTSGATEKHYGHLYYSVKYISPFVSRAIHLREAKVGKVPPIPPVHSFVTAFRELTNFVHTGKEIYSWRGASALRDCLKSIHSKNQHKEMFAQSFAFNALYKSLSRYFKDRRPNGGDPNTIAIAFLEKAPFNVYMESMALTNRKDTPQLSLEAMKNCIAALKDDSPMRDKIYALMDKYVELAEKRNHSKTLEEESDITIQMSKMVIDNKKLIDSVPKS